MKKYNIKDVLIQLIIILIINSFIIILSSKIFPNIKIDSFYYSVLASFIIMILNNYLKPLLEVLALPLNIISLGLLYPIIDTIILKLTSILLGSHFIVKGFITPLIVSIIISFITIIINNVFDKIMIRGEK